METTTQSFKNPFSAVSRAGLVKSLTFLVVGLGAVASSIPFIWMLLSAFKSNAELSTFPPTIFPQQWTLENISWMWNTIGFPRLLLNSLIVSVVVTGIALYTSSLVGYVLAKFHFRGKNLLFLFIISQMFIPWQVGMIVRWFMFDSAGLRNSLFALIIPGIYSVFGIFLMRQYMHTIPNSLMDAARIDGCSEIGIFHRIVLPNLGAPLSALAVFTFMFTYNDFFWPLIALNNPDQYTVPLGLAFSQGQYFNNNAYGMGGAAIAVIPMLLVFIFFQRRITEGITLTGTGGH